MKRKASDGSAQVFDELSEEAQRERSWEFYLDRTRKELAASPAADMHLAAANGDIEALKKLLGDVSRSIDERLIYHGTPLHVAVMFNQLETVECLIAAGADVEADGPEDAVYPGRKQSAVTLAARRGLVDVVEALWRAGASLLASKLPNYMHRQSALEIAALQGHTELVRRLFAWQVDWPGKINETALFLAVRRWDTDTVRVFLSNSHYSKKVLNNALLDAADRRIPIKDTIPPNHDAAAGLMQRSCLECLLDTGADIHARRDGATALHRAAWWCGEETPESQKMLEEPKTLEGLKTLLERGADIDARDDNGFTALAIASRPLRGGPRTQPRTRGVEALLQSGASLSVVDKRGNSPLHNFAFHGDVHLLELCLKVGADINAKNSCDETLLHAAAFGGSLEMVRFLISQGVDVNQRSSTGWTAIISCITPVRNLNTSPILGLVKFLVSNGSDVKDTTAEGWTALHRVAALKLSGYETEKLIEYLLDQGANIHAQAIGVRGTFLGHHMRNQNSHITSGHDVAEAFESIRREDPALVVAEMTPLHFAAQAGAVATIKILTDQGAHPGLRDSSGANPAVCAASSPELSLRQKCATIAQLLYAGASSEEEDDQGRSVDSWIREAGPALFREFTQGMVYGRGHCFLPDDRS